MTPSFILWLELFIWADFLFIMFLLLLPTLRKMADRLGQRSKLARFIAYSFAVISITALVIAPIMGDWLMLGYAEFWRILVSMIIVLTSPFYFLTTSIGVIAVWITYRIVFTEVFRKSHPHSLLRSG